jgi:hypothetical protein
MFDRSSRSTLQVALACALGALACGVVAIVTGYHIAFGIVAGLIVGYLVYDVRSVLKAIPVAFGEFVQWANEKRLGLIKFKAALTPSAVVSLAVAAFGLGPFVVTKAVAGSAGACALVAIFTVVAAVILTSFLYVLTTLFVAFGIEVVEKKRIVGSFNHEVVGMTYARYWTLAAKGFGLVLTFLLWDMEILLIKELCKGIVALATGLRTLFILIHRYERVLCSIDGTLGGVVAYVWLISPQRTVLQNAVAILFGIVLGVGWGVVNYEIVSKRVLKLVSVQQR